MRKTHWRLLALLGGVGLAVFIAAATVQVHAKPSGDGWLGVMIQDIDEDLRDSESLPSDEGVIISRVIDDSPAEKAGLERGDVVLKFDGRDSRSVRRLTRMIEWAEPNENVDLVILRDGKEQVVSVLIGERDTPDADFNFNWGHDGDHFFGHVPPVPPVPSGLRAPRAPRAFTFSLGQLSGAHIGVSLHELSEQLAERYGAKDGGALINEVIEDSPAEKAGLKAGDIIVEVDRKSVSNIDEIRDIIGDKDDGDKVAIRVLRPLDNTELTVDVEVEERNTWSGVGDHKLRSLSHGHSRSPEVLYWDNDNWQKSTESWREAVKDAGDEWRDELKEQLEDLREELKDLKNELREKGN